mmetsp:Transcript_66491/g.133994  ORF Transcript_66491/g.133994 Transcript_66491/m.133994 type:complete len:91 (+) Transcript_66491:757-1029(+)
MSLREVEELLGISPSAAPQQPVFVLGKADGGRSVSAGHEAGSNRGYSQGGSGFVEQEELPSSLETNRHQSARTAAAAAAIERAEAAESSR